VKIDRDKRAKKRSIPNYPYNRRPDFVVYYMMVDMKLKKIVLANHYGFCMGVKRAIKIALETGENGPGPVNVIHEIVHNDAVVQDLADRGIGYVSKVTEAPGGTVIVSAHGAPPSMFQEAAHRGLNVVDATCPLVIRIHKIIRKLIDNGYQVVHFGDIHHHETIGVIGQAPPGRVQVISGIDALQKLKPAGHRYALTAQTTADVADFKKIGARAKKTFPGIEVFNTICNATSQRQAAILQIAPEVQMMLVVGSASSANSNRLRSISEAICGRAYLINTADSLDELWLDGVETVGITAGASTPDFLVEEVVSRLEVFSGGTARVIRPGKKTGSRKRKPVGDRPR
jgi:4-hydroxy-3-methylbut-2-enyl diphosphate reductase